MLIIFGAGGILGARFRSPVEDEKLTRKPTDIAAPELEQPAKTPKPRTRKTTAAPVTTAEPPPASAGAGPKPPALLAAVAALEDMKAEDLSLIDLEGKTSIADWMVIASGRSTTQVGAMADKVLRALRDMGAPTPSVEGVPACDWVLIDAGDVILHLFRPEVRAFYNLEQMWGVDRPTETRAP